VGFDGFVHTVKCKICSKVETKDKILATKWDSLHKHVDWRKIDIPIQGVKKKEWYTSNACKHSKNQTTYASKGREFVFTTSD
jgi:heme-degrading monooxygenase HmoA